MRIALAQINATVGDFKANSEAITAFVQKALAAHAELVLFPELALCGYPPMDLLDQDSFVEQNSAALRRLQQQLPPDIAVGVGFVNRSPYPDGKSLVNEYGIILNRQIVFKQIKTLLPTYDVFDEARNFEAAREWHVFAWRGERIGIAICEDVWRDSGIPGTHYRCDPVTTLLNKGITLLCVPSASPFIAGKHTVRRALAQKIARRGNIPVLYLNTVGANDSIIFDGCSFAVMPDGAPLQSAAFDEALFVIDSQSGESSAPPDPIPDELDSIEQALIMGIRDYMAKCGFKNAHIGLSGGIDSALVAYLAVRAIGADHVQCFSMPSRFSSQGSKDDARELALNLKCHYETVAIEPVFDAVLATVAPLFENRPFDSAEENIQARIRGLILMAYANKFNSMLLATGNKSELAMGYCTIYGDMCGALAPIGDLFKTDVFALCRRINKRSPVIPEAILTKAPSAELRPNQRDQDSLPPYHVLDAILKYYLFDNLSTDEIAAQGYDHAVVRDIIRTVARAEFKRRQAPPVLKVSKRAFGMGRRMPIARAGYE
ncbi:MAG: NAD+ synthase [Treponema sp.]|jgi:NAD+ synthase (glutamine-hydrolysing)|nr:NAD+ synthase [Treponema sp.]